MSTRVSLGPRYWRVFAASVVSNLGDGVGVVAYPWLASAVTRNAGLVALVGVAQRLPWLLFTLPAGVITDRVDRRKAMIVMDTCRGVLTLLLAVVVAARADALPAPDALDAVAGTDGLLYAALLGATFLLGMAEVLRDNSAQTILPAVVEAQHLERANGRMWSAEAVANTFVGPPLGSLLLAGAFALPFFVDAASFFAAAALVALVPGTFRATPAADVPERAASSWRTELREGVGWLWRHPLLRQMAVILGLLNLAGMVTLSTFVLFAQEVLDIGPALFSVVLMGGAVGSVVGGVVAPRLSRRLGAGTCLALTLGGGAVINVLIGLLTAWPVAFVLFAVEVMLGMVWNVITVSLRQAIIPDALLGRVNSVYRFFAWGMMPIGAALGGLVVLAFDAFASRRFALQATFLVSGAIHAALFVFGRTRLTTARIAAARAAAPSGAHA